MKAFLILEDGTIFCGSRIGADREVISEIVFNTSMTGYLEVLSDPSYAGQAVVMTYPLIGNYGICEEDMESEKLWPDGFIVRELSRIPSNFRSGDTIQHFLQKHNIPGICGIDTRALTKILREKGTMNGMITTHVYEDYAKLLDRIRKYQVTGVVKATSCKEKYEIAPSEPQKAPVSVHTACRPGSLKWRMGEGKHVALMDLGAKNNIACSLSERGCRVSVFPCDTRAETILAARPDGIMLSNGPGDPKENQEIIQEIRRLYQSDVPIFAICLGHQLMALATGADTYKLKYGHRGGNHPVKDLETGRVYISSQNHGYAVDPDSLDPKVAVPAFVNVNDNTNEGLSYVGKNIFTVQFHPEACPGPQDSGYLFDRFIKMMGGKE
ncbi:MAG: carbamoyl phosphate synthase small subunit [Lachnospiraceae bacterium]|jgi:carbamoyl-phosphate synthase small subunit|nr:carbamoyl phosphate synthase small subunit [Lachnospiraceae bacterium]